MYQLNKTETHNSESDHLWSRFRIWEDCTNMHSRSPNNRWLANRKRFLPFVYPYLDANSVSPTMHSVSQLANQFVGQSVSLSVESVQSICQPAMHLRAVVGQSFSQPTTQYLTQSLKSQFTTHNCGFYHFQNRIVEILIMTEWILIMTEWFVASLRITLYLPHCGFSGLKICFISTYFYTGAIDRNKYKIQQYNTISPSLVCSPSSEWPQLRQLQVQECRRKLRLIAVKWLETLIPTSIHHYTSPREFFFYNRTLDSYNRLPESMINRCLNIDKPTTFILTIP